MFVGVERAAPATHSLFPLLFGLHTLPGPGQKEKLGDVTQAQPLQSLRQQCREARAAPGSPRH